MSGETCLSRDTGGCASGEGSPLRNEVVFRHGRTRLVRDWVAHCYDLSSPVLPAFMRTLMFGSFRWVGSHFALASGLKRVRVWGFAIEKLFRR